jgi:hypothetical protein
MEKLITFGTLCDRLGRPPEHRVRHFLRTQGITPVAKAGMAGVFSEEQIQKIEAEFPRNKEPRNG